MRLLISLLLLVPQIVLADTHYMSTTGTDSGDCTVSACATLQYSVSQMSSNDTLEIADGTYTITDSDGNDNFYTSTYGPPDGTGTGTGDSRFTIIKAENPLNVVFDLTSSTSQTFWYYSTSSWIKHDGIVFKGAVTGNFLISQDSTGHHLYFKRCGFAKENTSGASSSTVWIYGTYNLFEDCFLWGSGKYLLHDRGDHNVYRRLVARADNLDGGNQPSASLMSYEGEYIEWQNILILDADEDYWTNASYVLGGWATHHEADQTGTDYNYVRGSICLNNETKFNSGAVNTCWWIDGNSSTNNEFHNVVAAGSTGGFTAPSGDYNNFCYNCVAVNLSDPDGAARGFNGFELVQDSIAYNNEVGVYNVDLVDYSNVYGNTTNNSGSTITNAVSGDPTASGLSYIARIESGSTLKTAGLGGGQVGADITKKIGVDGTFYGDTNYNSVTSNDLWPWPYESEIRSYMRQYSPGSLSGERGFCADGETLTSYIWEYLGNSSPFNSSIIKSSSFRLGGGWARIIPEE